MLLRLCLLAFCAVFALQAQVQMNVEQLADFVRSELALKQHTDKQIANYIKQNITLSEKLTDKTIIDLEAQGAGPKTAQALRELRDKTAAMKPPAHDATSSPATAPDSTLTATPPTATLSPKAPPIPPPDSVRQQQILDLMKQYALSYTQNLPNFMCVEVIRQYVDLNASDNYRSIGNILAKVGYNEGHEKYQVYSINGHYQQTTIENAASHGGAISTGEFGSMLRAVFEPKSEAEFGWDHWGTLRGRRMAVFNFHIDSGHSEYSIDYSAGPGDDQRIYTAYKGLIYGDADTGEVARVTLVAVDIPKSFPVTAAMEILDYDQVDISGHPYICPLIAKLYMTAGRQKQKNVIEFRDYRKFEAGSVITYDKAALGPAEAPPPLPASKTEEQPASASQPAKRDNAKKGSGSAPWWALPAPPPPPPTTAHQ